MNDESSSPAPITTFPLESSMATPTHRKPRSRRNAKPKPKHAPRRNAKSKPKHAPHRYRNAGPTTARTPVTKKPKEPTTFKETLVQLGETLGGAALTSVIGAYAVKWGLHPELVSVGLGAAGVYAATSQKEPIRFAGSGAASAAGSQLVLLKLNPTPDASKVAAQPPPKPPTQTAQLPRPKNADLGALPPGMLDAAFERARAELAVTGDGYPPGYEPEHHRFHHGPVMPDRP